MMRPTAAAPQSQRLIQWATLLAGVSLVLVIVNIVLAVVDQTAQAEVNQRQQQLAQAAQLEAITNVLTRALVAQADTVNDAQIRDLLKRAGVPQASAGPATSPNAPSATAPLAAAPLAGPATPAPKP